ncbi:hypothetical protein [Micromonospora sp. NPDC049891]|uniref:hypothetical protein n=1 Tax=Micromonospora sp. NPDC049891 TaxID=3155655 RepID=UPI0033F77A3C
MAFHDDLHTLAHHARTSSDPDTRAAANRLLTGAHALLPEPARVDWAEAILYTDGETRYIERLDEADAREHATYLDRQVREGKPGHSDTARAFVVFREVRMLVDGTQINGPWMAPADQFTERQQ